MKRTKSWIRLGGRNRTARVLGAAIAALVTLAAVIATPGTAYAFEACSRHDYITSQSANAYVSTELGYSGSRNGMLRARAATPGPWENYTFCYNYDIRGAKVWSIQSEANGRWVSAEFGYAGGLKGMLRARATSVGAWEKFYIFRLDGRGAWIFQTAAYSLYVSVEMGYTGVDQNMLRARATQIGPWEHLGVLCPASFLGSCPP